MTAAIVIIFVTAVIVLISVSFGYFLGITRDRNE